jgi:hypothetical protein
MPDMEAAIDSCINMLEADARRDGCLLPVRDLSRKTPGTSGVESIGSPSGEAYAEHDTAPASRPLFLGGLSSSTFVAKPGARVPSPPAEAGVALAAAPSSAERPTLFRDTGIPQTTTAPLGSPRSQARPAQTSPTTSANPRVEREPPVRVDAGRSQHRSAPRALVKAEPPEVDEFTPDWDTALAPLVWGMATGVLLFGVGALLLVASKRPAPHPQSSTPAPSVAELARSRGLATQNQAPSRTGSTKPTPLPAPAAAASTRSVSPSVPAAPRQSAPSVEASIERKKAQRGPEPTKPVAKAHIEPIF